MWANLLIFNILIVEKSVGHLNKINLKNGDI